MFKSEAQAYQEWRRNVKKQLQIAQRYQTFYKWQVDYGELHPRLQRQTYRPLPVSHPWDVWQKWCKKASELQFILDRFKVKNV
jgi:hypothetical protein